MSHDSLDSHEVADLAEEYALGKVTSVTPAPTAWSRRGNHQTNLLLDASRGKVIVLFDEVIG